ncbi:hypothetical protein AVEN_214631-1 [Araneus ventricosus]|uniref:Uncharacterized protein n=1 Tax=Araneus ventricosus TaxID=182803 RepID=A0A4Y2LED4_ARAVE|nr:hypothetical protein AVEN_214631-1 [Araneus ventricosus]
MKQTKHLERALAQEFIIEDIRDALLHAVENRSPPPRTPMDLWTVLKDEWCELPPRYLQTLVESLPHRVAALLQKTPKMKLCDREESDQLGKHSPQKSYAMCSGLSSIKFITPCKYRRTVYWLSILLC